jgi:class III poly(R)-hydroxyalkanoic acid synthase PhaE subunit
MSQGPDPAELYHAMIDQWRRVVLAQPGFQSAAQGWTLSDLVERYLAAQSTTMRLVELSLDAWRELLPKVGTGEDWRTSITALAGRFREQLLSDAGTEGTASEAQLWPQYLAHLQRLGLPMLDAFREAPGRLQEAAFGEDPELTRLTNLFWDSYAQTFGRLLRSPGLGPGRETSEKLERGFDAWLEWSRASFRYQTIIADTWVRALERFLSELADRAARGESPATVRALTNLYMETAEAVFVEKFMSTEYIEAQAQAGNASMEYWRREREIVDGLMKISHVPTRTEVDEAHRQVHELRKELRALRRELRELRHAQRRAPAAGGTPHVPVSAGAEEEESD